MLVFMQNVVRWYLGVSKPTAEFTGKLDRLQRWVFCRTHEIRWRADHDERDFQAWRHRASSRASREVGLWSGKILSFFVKWQDHCVRRSFHPNQPWFVQLLQWHDNLWLEQQRTSHGNSRSVRTGTRAARGRPFPRHAELVTRARALIAQ